MTAGNEDKSDRLTPRRRRPKQSLDPTQSLFEQRSEDCSRDPTPTRPADADPGIAIDARSPQGPNPNADGDGMRQLLTVPQAAAALNVSVRTCWRLIAAGELARVNIGRCVRVNKRSVQQLIKRGGTR